MIGRNLNVLIQSSKVQQDGWLSQLLDLLQDLPKELTGNRHLRQLRRREPGLMDGLRSDLDQFLPRFGQGRFAHASGRACPRARAMMSSTRQPGWQGWRSMRSQEFKRCMWTPSGGEAATLIEEAQGNPQPGLANDRF